MFNFYEYRARAYNPTLGRFMSEDPKLFVRHVGLGAATADWSLGAHPDEAEYNLFRYCGNDPLDFTDPMGLEDFYPNAHITAYSYGPDNAYAGHPNGYDSVAYATDPVRREMVYNKSGKIVDVIQHAALGDNSFAHPSSMAVHPDSKIPFGSLVYVQGKGWFVVEDTHGRTAEGKKLDQRFDMYSGKSDKKTRDSLSGRADATVYGPKESVPKDVQQKGPGEGWLLSPDKEKVILKIPVRQTTGQ